MKDTKLTRASATRQGPVGRLAAFTIACIVSLTSPDDVDRFGDPRVLDHGAGGFFLHDESFGYSSPGDRGGDDRVMLAASLNFATQFSRCQALARAVCADVEARRVMIWMIGASVGIAAFRVARGPTRTRDGAAARRLQRRLDRLHDGVASVDFRSGRSSRRPDVFLSCSRTSSGSTAGHQDGARRVLFKQAVREMTRIIHRGRSCGEVRRAGDRDNVIFAVLAFMLMWAGRSS